LISHIYTSLSVWWFWKTVKKCKDCYF